MFRGKAEKKMREAGYDPARLPPGQYLTEKWPVLHAGSAPSIRLISTAGTSRVSGEVDNPLTLSWEQLNALPRVEVTQDIHCVTRWSRFDASFAGIPWSALRELAGQRPTARFAIAHAEAGFTSNIPIDFLEREGAMLATHADGEPLSGSTAGRCA